MLDHIPKAIEQLKLDHRNMARLLDLVQSELESMRAGEPPDFDLLHSVMEYALHYPDICHHPKEDAIYRRLVRRDPSTEARVGDLAKEHAHLSELTRKLAAALHNVAQDVEVPRCAGRRGWWRITSRQIDGIWRWKSSVSSRWR